MPEVWGSMLYICRDCGHDRRMYLEVGVEGPPGHKEMPCPFSITCPVCHNFGSMRHTLWYLDEAFPPRKVKEHESYFKLSKSKSANACGRAVFKGGA